MDYINEKLLLVLKGNIAEIQEVELVSRGYRVSKSAIPASRNESGLESNKIHLLGVRNAIESSICNAIIELCKYLKIYYSASEPELDLDFIENTASRMLKEYSPKPVVAIKELKESYNILKYMVSFITEHVESWLNESDSSYKSNELFIVNGNNLREALERIHDDFIEEYERRIPSNEIKRQVKNNVVKLSKGTRLLLRISETLLTIKARTTLLLSNNITEERGLGDKKENVLMNNSEQIALIEEELELLNTLFTELKGQTDDKNFETEEQQMGKIGAKVGGPLAESDISKFESVEIEADCGVDYDMDVSGQVFESIGEFISEKRIGGSRVNMYYID
ncbi:hypothetical protein BB559_003106 [Furculomyces boomerangus]|uniref:Myosin-binding domain-containing protein n=2 Tax=Harpellales TaxID=61421 RepID=A0A2T9YNV9_9FUNG|nr:hypothetical protein BB559_003106 [Furculomyces boomerangus]PWA02749.1 hypothetical protein BB558_001100 [Smittium angustum]